MKSSFGMHLVFIAWILIATFGAGQVWSLALALRAADAGMGDMVAGAVGLGLLMISGLVLGRFLYVLAHVQRSKPTQEREVHDETKG